MIEKIEKISPKKRALITVVCILIILGVIFSITGNEHRKKVKAFDKAAAETLDLYGDTIESYHIKSLYVRVNVNTQKFASVSEEQQKAFYQEVYALLRVNAVTTGVLEDVVTLSFYSGDNRLALYSISE